MRILVLNSGSSSIKLSMFDSRFDSGAPEEAAEPQAIYDGELSGIGADPKLEITGKGASAQELSIARPVECADWKAAVGLVLDAVRDPQMPSVDAIGYRVVHAGAKLDRHQRITDAVLADLEQAVEFAPLHGPAALTLIREGMKRFPEVPHYACFDTVFHQTMPPEATVYPVPQTHRDRGVRRYGFHGLSLESIVRQMSASGGAIPERMAIAHLGSGCSVTALREGRSIDTTMGLTPTGGVVMGTRPGDLDPGLVLYLLRQQRGGREEAISAVEALLNHDSGMVALSGLPNDLKAVRQAATNGDERAVLALKVFTRSISKAIGGFCWLMGGLDAIVFTGGIGEHDAASRAAILEGLEGLGLALDVTRNRAPAGKLTQVGASESKTAIFIAPSQEDRMIAVHVDRMVRSGNS